MPKKQENEITNRIKKAGCNEYSRLLSEFDSKIENPLPTCKLGTYKVATLEYTAELIRDLSFLLGEWTVERMFGVSYSERIETIEELEMKLSKIVAEKIKTDVPERLAIKDYLTVTKENKWDLWTAIPDIFEDLKIGHPMNVPNHRRGQKDENFKLGLILGFTLFYFADHLKLEDFIGYKA